MSKSGPAQRTIDRYLNHVARALRDADPLERHDILDGLRVHIDEALAERGVSNPSVGDVRAVLATMDIPEAYRSEVSRELKNASRHGRIGRTAFGFFLGALGASALALMLGALLSNGAILRGGLILAGMLALSALVFGLLGWKDPYGKASVVGTIIALACALLFLPVQKAPTPSQSPDPVVEAIPSSE